MTTSHDFLGAIDKGNEEGAVQALDKLVQDQTTATLGLQANPSLLAHNAAVKEELRVIVATLDQVCTAYDKVLRMIGEAEEAARLAANGN